MTGAQLIRVLRSVGVSLRRAPDGGLALEGPEDEVREYLDEIRRLKPMLIAGACELCDYELAVNGDRCSWCDAVRGREVVYAPGSLAERQFLAELEAVAAGRYADPADKASTLPPLPPRGVLVHSEPAPDRARECQRCHRTLYQDPGGHLTRGEPCFLCQRGQAATREAA